MNNGSALNLVEVWDTQYVQTGMDDADSAVLTVAPSRAGALIGAGPTGAPLQPEFGNVDFKAYNINFANKAVSSSRLIYCDDVHLVTGKLRHITSAGDGHILCECVVLWVCVCELSGYVVYGAEWEYVCG